jgi:hypothetical protein
MGLLEKKALRQSHDACRATNGVTMCQLIVPACTTSAMAKGCAILFSGANSIIVYGAFPNTLGDLFEPQFAQDASCIFRQFSEQKHAGRVGRFR